ncbi:hypothetical protein IR083_00245 [Dysgonomonas sp. GY75]|uniref:hypothetical protein n=1 Tax=Dysgonomonas sp. GY75 TaxID=2780419 RepID=UPI0018848DEA|nr:hypothetical protein [Dysgonomonas sp. GY75]MBF0647251.1 hypothetical protein [Dysgonomonas sp. GY75]
MDAVKDYFEQQRAEEQVEKELNVDRWVIISIGYRSRIPVYLKEKYDWVIRWRVAKLQCSYPKESICTWHTHYDKRTSLRLEYDSLYTKIISAKAWLTRAKNKVKKYEEERNRTLFQDFENDPIWLDAMQKVKAKEDKLAYLQEVLRTETEKYHAKAS